jgi:hypothetical protein
MSFSPFTVAHAVPGRRGLPAFAVSSNGTRRQSALMMIWSALAIAVDWPVASGHRPGQATPGKPQCAPSYELLNSVKRNSHFIKRK